MRKLNSGRQLKVLAVIIFIMIFGIGCYLSHDYAMERVSYRLGYYDYELNTGVFCLGLVIFAVAGYLSAIVLYAFGSLVDSSVRTAENTDKILSELRLHQKTNSSDTP